MMLSVEMHKGRPREFKRIKRVDDAIYYCKLLTRLNRLRVAVLWPAAHTSCSSAAHEFCASVVPPTTNPEILKH